MTVKKSKAAKLAVTTSESSEFTASENKLIDHLEAKKKVKHAKKPEENESKVGKMFKKKKEIKVEPEEVEEAPKKSKKSILKKQNIIVKNEMEVDEDDSEVVMKPSKKGAKKQTEDEPLEDTVIPGFAAPKKTAPKRKHDEEFVHSKKAKKAPKEKKEVDKKALKAERKSKENPSRYLLSVKAKKIWEELRREDTTKDKQLSLSAELYGMLKGHTQEVSVY